MCHAVRVRLSPAEKKEVRKLSGVMIPVYASIVIVLFAVTLILRTPNAGDAIASATIGPPASNVQPANR